MKPWDQIREARPCDKRNSSSKSDFNTQENQRKREAIYCELNSHWTLGPAYMQSHTPTVVQGVGECGGGGGLGWWNLSPEL